jgi:hypothetical protein
MDSPDRGDSQLPNPVSKDVKIPLGINQNHVVLPYFLSPQGVDLLGGSESGIDSLQGKADEGFGFSYILSPGGNFRRGFLSGEGVEADGEQ